MPLTEKKLDDFEVTPQMTARVEIENANGDIWKSEGWMQSMELESAGMDDHVIYHLAYGVMNSKATKQKTKRFTEVKTTKVCIPALTSANIAAAAAQAGVGSDAGFELEHRGNAITLTFREEYYSG